MVAAAVAAAAPAVMANMSGEGVGAVTGSLLIRAIHCKGAWIDADAEEGEG